MLFGWCADTPPEQLARIGRAMGDALRVHAGHRFQLWTVPGLTMGRFELPPVEGASEADEAAPAQEGVHSLWMAGEVFAWRSHQLAGPMEGATLAFRQRLLRALLERGDEVLRDLDGEWQIALWDGSRRLLRVWLDRFAAVPLYWSANADGSAFAGGVRGVLIAPGVAVDPDVDALRDAVSFGGFRLGDRTNVKAVRMAPCAAALTISAGSCRVDRHWRWNQLDETPEPNATVLLERTRARWQEAIRRRLDGSARPGLTLSGGLDSRAILAEAARQRSPVSALTYGVPESDDVRFARRTARACGATWQLFPLYTPGWLERRERHLLRTDGLIQLVDLMHCEPLDDLPRSFDTLLSGYIGDLVSGGTWMATDTVDGVLQALPYYGGRLAVPPAEAAARVEEMLGATTGDKCFVMYDEKLRQAIARISDAARPYVRVRRPFVDYAFFENARRIPLAMRRGHRWHEAWLRTTYPEAFARIPHQRTGARLGLAPWRVRLARARRYTWRRAVAGLARAGVAVQVPSRTFHPDERHWSAPAAREILEGTILRPGSLACDILGRAAVADTLREFFESGGAPTQVVGALFIYERYHQTLAGSLADVRTRAEGVTC